MTELPGWYLALTAFAFGAAFGSFANVVIHRVPLGRSVIRPGSACPSCERPIAWYDNLPGVSYLVLRGRCRHCGWKISPRYLAVELLVGGAWALIALRRGLSSDLPLYLALATTLVILSAIDLEHRRIPDRILAPAALLAGGLLLLAALPGGEWARLGLSGLGALAYGLPMLALGLAVPHGMGMGDVKLSAYLGLHLGWLSLLHVLAGALLGFLAGGVIAMALVATRRRGRKDPIPFGPFMALGAFVAVLAGSEILALWLG